MSEKKMILEMLQNGEISADEAERLLYALRGKEKQRRRDRKRDFDGGMDDFREGIERVFQNIHKFDVSKVVREVVETADRHSVGEIVGRVIDEVRDVARDLTGEESREISDSLDLSEEIGEAEILTAKIGNGCIELSGTDKERVEIHAVKRISGPDEDTCRKWLEEVDVNVERKENLLSVSESGPDLPPGYSGNIDLTLSCPNHFSIDLVSANGHISASGTTANARLVSANGNLKLKGCNGTVSMKTSNGMVHGEIENIHSPAEFKTVNGSINVAVANLEASLSTRSRNGSISLTLPDEFTGKLAAETSVGTVRCAFDIKGRVRKNKVEGTVGKGGKVEIDARTTSGSIDIKKG